LNKYDSFEPDDMTAFLPTEKIGMLGTVTPEGLPHLTLITAMQAKTEKQIIWGQFTHGTSKQFVRENPNTGFLIMSMDRRMWRGKARYTHFMQQGEDHRMFNEKPMFRYNSYFGINTVYYMDLVETFGAEGLPLGKIIPAALLTTAAKSFAKSSADHQIMNRWTQNLFNKLDSLKFLSYIGEDGFPTIIPLLQCRASDTGRLVFSPMAYAQQLAKVPAGAQVAIFGLTLAMEDVLVRGKFIGYSRYAGIKLGAMDVDWVYNSMPPNHRQIYPEQPFTAVENF